MGLSTLGTLPETTALPPTARVSTEPSAWARDLIARLASDYQMLLAVLREIDGLLTNGITFVEQAADPPAPAVNSAIFYAKDNGAGKTQFCVRFNTGAVQVLATQP